MMTTKFQDFIVTKTKLGQKDRILLTVSGGADSVVMLHLFSKSGISCGVAHCNFHLRGNDSDLDEALVKRLAEKYHFPYYQIDFDTVQYAADHGISIEMAARDLRYEWFEKIRKENDYQYIATAHHQDDLIETFFINLSRGTGIRGLTGFSPKKGKIIRPMLFTNRKSIMEYIRKEKLEYREDCTNSDVKIIRNKLRHQIIPKFEEINPMFRQNILQSINNLNDAEFLMNNEMIKFRNEVMLQDGEIWSIDISKLLEYRTIHPYLYEILQVFGFNSNQVTDIEKALKSEPGKVFYSKSHQLNKDRNQLIISPVLNEKFSEIIVNENDKHIFLPSGSVLSIQIIEKDKAYKIQKEPEIAAIDFDQLKFPLLIRKWEQGDYFYPLGMNKRKKISDFLIDEKINLIEKQQVLILVSDNQIVWVIGKRLDNRYKLAANTRKIIELNIANTKKSAQP